jgi:hypothetical protein
MTKTDKTAQQLQQPATPGNWVMTRQRTEYVWLVVPAAERDEAEKWLKDEGYKITNVRDYYDPELWRIDITRVELLANRELAS